MILLEKVDDNEVILLLVFTATAIFGDTILVDLVEELLFGEVVMLIKLDIVL